MPCPAHSQTPQSGGSHIRVLESARPPSEDAVAQHQARNLASELESIHESILSGLLASTAAIPLTSVGAIRRHISLRFERYGQPFADQFTQLVYEGADLGRATAVRRYGLDVSPTFGDSVGGTITDLSPADAARRDIERTSRRARSNVVPRMVDDISRSIHDAYEAGLSREEIHDRLRNNRFEHARTVEARRIAETELPAASNRGALAAYEDAGVAKKSWVGILDARIRRTHRRANGQTVSIGESFSIGGFDARWPGDYRLPPSERIRCRCFVRPSSASLEDIT